MQTSPTAPMMTSTRAIAASSSSLVTGPGGLKCPCCTAFTMMGKGKRITKRTTRRNERQQFRADIRNGNY